MLNSLSFSTNKLMGTSVRNFCLSKMSPNQCRVAVCQFTATNNKANNLETVKKLVTEAAKKNAKVIFLPEACDFIGSNTEDSRILAEPVTGLLMSEYKSLAHDLNVWLSVGGFHELVHGESGTSKVYNSHVLIDSNGEIRANYRKIHLFDVSIPERNILLKESDSIQRGCDVIPPVDTPAGKMALSICYDLRFPELSIIQRKQGASILTFPSAFTRATGMVHWEVLVRARAIENQCYVIAAAQYGKHNEKRLSWGQSMIVDPWGKIIAECPKYMEDNEETNESIAYATIDAKLSDNIRVEMPVLQHRRDDIYQLNQVKHDATSLPIDDAEIFKFAEKSIPGSTVFYRTRLSYAFTNIRCVIPGHVLVSSIRPTARLADLTEEEIADLFNTAVKVLKVMEKTRNSTSTTICVQDGKDAGQSVNHVHVHILPRTKNDFQRNDDIYEQLAKHDREDVPTPPRSLQEMREEAQFLRQFFVQPALSDNTVKDSL